MSKYPFYKFNVKFQDPNRIESDLTTHKELYVRCTEEYPHKVFTNTNRGRKALYLHIIRKHNCYGHYEFVKLNKNHDVEVIDEEVYKC